MKQYKKGKTIIMEINDATFIGVLFRTNLEKLSGVDVRILTKLKNFVKELDNTAKDKGIDYYTYYQSGEGLLSRFTVKRNLSKRNNVIALFDMEPCDKRLKYLPKFIYRIDEGVLGFYPEYKIDGNLYCASGGDSFDSIEFNHLKESSIRIFDEITGIGIDPSLIKIRVYNDVEERKDENESED